MRNAAAALAALAWLAVPRAAAAPAALERAADEPALPTGRDILDRPYPPLSYARFPARARPAPLRGRDVVQGRLGSCFFLSTLAAIAEARPGFLAGRIRGTGGGAYAVTLFDAAGRRASVAVDDRFPATASGAPFFARGVEAGEIRPALFEKAFAKLAGGYSAIDGGEARDAFRALTGAAARDYAPDRLGADAVWRLLRGAARDGRPAAAATRELAELKRLTRRDDLAGVIDDHVYAVLGVEERAGARLVRLYTPLSPGDAGYAKDGPRLLELTLADFRKYFDTLTIGAFRS